MKLISNTLIAAMLASSLTVTTGILVPSQAYAASKAYCRDYAQQKANRKATGRVVTGAVVGAGLGLLGGAILGGHHAQRRGALFGAVGGTVVGGVNANEKWRRTYNKAYYQCRNEL